MMKGVLCIFVPLVLFITAYTNASPALPLFSIVKFKNVDCKASTTRRGTCYTADECKNLGGKKMGGNCAEGFGICCLFEDMKCGHKTSQNSTYLLSTKDPTKVAAKQSCSYTICAANRNICRIKYSFTALTLSSPHQGSTATAAPAALTNGKNAGNAVGACTGDNMEITGVTGSSPVICGVNTGQHMILDSDGSDDNCHHVNINMGSTTTTRSWDIAVTQYECKDMTALENTAGPKGCLQYFLGDKNGGGFLDNFGHAVSTKTTTYDASTTHLQNQDYNICIRRHAKSTRICYARIVDKAGTGSAQGSFGLSVTAATKAQNEVDAKCLTDYITIPFAVTSSITKGTVKPSAFKICGRNFNQAATATITAASVCSHSLPFQMGVKFDGSEKEATASATMIIDESYGPPSAYVGFHLAFTQDTK